MIATLEGPGAIFVGKFFCYANHNPTFCNRPLKFKASQYDIASLLLEHNDELANCNLLLLDEDDPRFRMLLDMESNLHKLFSYLTAQACKRRLGLYICSETTGWVDDRLKHADINGTCRDKEKEVTATLNSRTKRYRITIQKAEYQCLI